MCADAQTGQYLYIPQVVLTMPRHDMAKMMSNIILTTALSNVFTKSHVILSSVNPVVVLSWTKVNDPSMCGYSNVDLPWLTPDLT